MLPLLTSFSIDGTHISAWVPTDRQISFRGRKIVITKNVMCACDFDMIFTFVYVGWEGTTNNAHVFLDALSRLEVNFPWPSEGKFWLSLYIWIFATISR